MKKNVIILSLILLIVIIICTVEINQNVNQNRISKQENRQYEQYLESEIYGIEVVTLINQAISNNQKNNVTTDTKGFYKDDNKNCIRIDLVMLTNEEEGKTTTYKMETIAKVGMKEFIKNFNTAKFKCSKKEYHKQTGKIAYIELTQLGN